MRDQVGRISERSLAAFAIFVELSAVRRLSAHVVGAFGVPFPENLGKVRMQSPAAETARQRKRSSGRKPWLESMALL